MRTAFLLLAALLLGCPPDEPEDHDRVRRKCHVTCEPDCGEICEPANDSNHDAPREAS